jgi:hypothetical protein
MVLSPKPLPIHSEPLRPSLGRAGPNAAGRARKKVELSSVRLMMAEGGNREPGEAKENRALKLAWLDSEFADMISCSSSLDDASTM